MAKVAIIHRDEIPGLPSKYTEEELQVVVEMVDEMFEKLGGIGEFIKPGETVVLKPNCSTYFGSVMKDEKTGEEVVNYQGAANTDARVLAALTRLALQKGEAKEVLTGETCAFDFHERWQSKITLEVSGIKAAVEAEGGQAVDFNELPRKEITIPDPIAVEKLAVPEILTEENTVFINVPALKTHTFETVTLGMKNYQGILKWEDKLKAHNAALSYKFVDMVRALPPRLTVIAGIWAVQGQGPIPIRGKDFMTISDMNCIIGGDNIVATDAVGAAVMGINPMSVRTIRVAASEGLGPADVSDPNKIELVGESIENVKRNFIPASNEIVGVYPNVRIYSGGTCYVCQSLLRAMLDGLEFTLGAFKDDPLYFIIGKDPYIPEFLRDSDKNVWVIGDCAQQYRELTSNTHFYPGCTPMDANITLPGTVIAIWKEKRASK